METFPIDSLLDARRDGCEQSAEEISAFVEGVVNGSVTRPQAAAWLAFVYLNGMTEAETVALTIAMRDSGECLSWSNIAGPFIDKHSTGGVGDKVSLVLAPVWAAMGFKVPMLSGRGLGITGGTLDKLEAIPGYRTDLNQQQLTTCLQQAGCFINGQTSEVAPADRILYALRDETQTVPSIPLITASILSKKLVEGIESLVLDVKCGCGAFMKTRKDAEALAESLVRVGNGAGVKTSAHITDMSQPLGATIGNSLEVEEAVATLMGDGDPELRQLVCKLSGDPTDAVRVLNDGSAFEKWCTMVRCHDGDPDAPLLGANRGEYTYLASRSGVISNVDAGDLGLAAFRLGAGRSMAGEEIHPGVGIKLLAKKDDKVTKGQPLATLYHQQERGLEAAKTLAKQGFLIS